MWALRQVKARLVMALICRAWPRQVKARMGSLEEELAMRDEARPRPTRCTSAALRECSPCATRHARDAHFKLARQVRQTREL